MASFKTSEMAEVYLHWSGTTVSYHHQTEGASLTHFVQILVDVLNLINCSSVPV